MDLDDTFDETFKDTQREIEDERSNGDRSVYINRRLICSSQYIKAIRSLEENRCCTKSIRGAARKMLKHHHGDKYEDLYFVDSVTGKTLSRTDYREEEQKVFPTKAMKKMVKDNPGLIIAIHNHPSDTFPSNEDIKVCYEAGYKYGLVFGHGGNIFQYKTVGKPNLGLFDMECHIYYQNEWQLACDLLQKGITKQEFISRHQKSIEEFVRKMTDANIIFREVLWNGKPYDYKK